MSGWLACDRQVELYAGRGLTVEQTIRKWAPADDGNDPRIANPMASRLITCRNMTLARFAVELNRIFVELPPVLDATGLSGKYDMTINFSPTTVFDPADSDPNGAISFPEALRKQLGLKFESRKVMAPVLVIDHVNEMPTEN